MCSHSQRKSHKQYDSYQLYQCQECQLTFNPIYENNFDLIKLYNDFYDAEGERFSPPIEMIVRYFRWCRALYIKLSTSKAKSVLDIGSGRGYLLYYLKKYFQFKRVEGTQIANKAAKFSQDQLGLKIYQQDLLNINLKPNNFDVIILWHVLEHVSSPENYINKIQTLLTNKGKLFIQVPNYNSWTAKFTGKYWLGLDLKYHLYFFTPKSLKNILKKKGFKIERVSTFSAEYSNVISIQSILGLLTKQDRAIFDTLTSKKINTNLLPSIILAILITPLSLVINFLLWKTDYGEVINIIATKK